MKRALSLRARLTGIILVPLLTIAGGIGLWELNNARRTATEVFDRSLLSAALAVSNDVAISGGDALSARTRDILASTSGGQVFYHVYAPDGVIVSGYATPPVGIPRDLAEPSQPTTFEAVYRGQDVRGVRLQNRTEVDGFAGVFTTTVWQDNAVRQAFVQDLVLRAFMTISALMVSLALIVWFGVRLGLRPLLDLEAAIARRSERELSPIQRAVPQEVGGIVTTLNQLLGQVSRSMTAQSDFVANAAHQLRNPIAGVLSLAEAVVKAPDPAAQERRAADLLHAAREAAELSQKLLLLERADAISPLALHESIDLAEALPDWIAAAEARVPARVTLSLKVAAGVPLVYGDPTMLREALLNLVNNAVIHGGASLSAIDVRAEQAGDHVRLSVSDDGIGMSEADIARALERFAQVAETSVSGLGLSIVAAVAEGHAGRLTLTSRGGGLTAEMYLPLQRPR